MKALFRFLIIPFLLFRFAAYGQDGPTYLFAGTYTDGQPDKGIYIYRFNPRNGKLKLTGHGDGITNPSFLTLSPDGRFLYACTDTKMPKPGSVTAFSIDPAKGRITPTNKQSAGGENPVYVAADQTGRFVVEGNYTGGSASVFTVRDDGGLDPAEQFLQFTGSGVIADRQEKSHVHSTVFSPDNRYVFMPDLGADKIRVFRFDQDAALPLQPMEDLDITATPGAGPRHFTFHPNGRFAYCAEELSGTVCAYGYRDGKLDSLQRVFAYSKKQDIYSSADIHVSPDGKFLYVSNRLDQENTIAVFSIDPASGKLSLAGHQSTLGDTPRNFTLDPTGRYLLVANQATNNIFVFKRDPATGLLTRTGKEVRVPAPSCLQMRTYGR